MKRFFIPTLILTLSGQVFGSDFGYREVYVSVPGGGASGQSGSSSLSSVGDRIEVAQEFYYSGDSLGSHAPNNTRTNKILAYKGPSGNFAVSFGPYHNGIVGKKIEAFLVFESINLNPYMIQSSYDTCTRRDWRQKCVSWDTHYVTYPQDNGFIIDMVTNIGARGLDSKMIRAPFTDDLRYDEPDTDVKLLRSKSLIYYLADGEVIDNLEVRMLNPFGADIDVKIKYAVIRVFPND